MNQFSADFSSSPAQTPPRRRDLFFNEPNISSTTPLVPPPSTVFGSSRFGSGKSNTLFGKQTPSTASKSTRHAPPPQRNARPSPRSNDFHSSYATSRGSESTERDGFEEDEPIPVQSLMKFSTNSARQSKSRSVFKRSTNSHSTLPNKGQPAVISGLARDLGSRAKAAPLEDDDALLLDTELFLQQLHNEKEQNMDEDGMRSLIDVQVKDLLNLWRNNADSTGHDTTDIGPPASAAAFDKANYLASLILNLHHPGESSIPGVILTWLNNHHVSYDPLLRSVASAQPNPTAHDLFWDAVLALVLRGRLQDAMRLLADADFQYAATAMDDGEQDPGFHGAQLQTIQSVIFRARQVINSCPGMTGDWETTSEEWNNYRGNIEAELENLGHLASGGDDDDDFEAENFGVNKPRRELLRKSQRSRNLPWSIYQGVRVLYSILSGGADETIAQSQDWLEAACALTIWWDGASDSSIQKWRLDVSQAPEDAPLASYLSRLRDAFLCVTDPEGKNTFPINSLSPVEVALGCALQGNVSGFLTVTRVLSQCVAAAIAEIASTAGWIGSGSNAGFDLDDLMVLSYGGVKPDLTKDDVLTQYAAALFGLSSLATENPSGVIEVEGWEVSLSILSRLDDEQLTRDSVHELLDQLPVSDQARTEKIINLCTDLRFMDEARAMSDKLGDHLAHNTTQYGLALLCYAKSHNAVRIQQLTEMLISYCLVQSCPYPEENELDEALRGLVETPKSAFAAIIDADPEAASILQFYVVGYACVRRIFVLRDQEHSTQRNKTSRPNLRARKRVAAKAIVAAVNSAADSIYGGLYDAERQTAIQADALLPLLGEATALLAKDHDNRSFTNEQMYALLAAIEDLETVNARVREATDACLSASIGEYRGSQPPSPRAMLKKSMSSGKDSNFSFSLMGSEMMGSGTSGGGRSDGSAVLVDGKGEGVRQMQRGWDWREAFRGVPVEEVGRVVLTTLRKGIAKELAMGELEL
ncbi:uncharacterized protein HMPREF1541_07111 [Cyphellophora europaea CBS 101466]|uniref:Nuclear pore complex protein Nup85 n=1 Tax=Cyphellophora europaea (strain CBS 101466) TaxID=1220924 RepID=W2RP42_CYPE1|nr:uncharacterized protein HMPREF1541_07111 [Cyphellophora europaea CBS 101466]ETN37489.1 hypothetical protein HMPREF1541_07111 [Cyphellophora europaea CBS 101466]